MSGCDVSSADFVDIASARADHHGLYRMGHRGERLARWVEIQRRRPQLPSIKMGIELWARMRRPGRMVGPVGPGRLRWRRRLHGIVLLIVQKNVLNRRTWTARDELRIEIVNWIERAYH